MPWSNDPKRIPFGQGTCKGKGMAVLTSGGDSQGMNAAVRATVRMGLYLGCRVYFIREGYQGLVDGKGFIEEANWSSVSGIIHQGGTVIGSARCMEFRERSGRLKGAKNLIEKGVTNLVVIGGDGSLTGASIFRNDWSSLLNELLEKNEITQEDMAKYPVLNIVGLVGSIDNDFCGTDMTIGTDTALHRIIDCIDAIRSTAKSHQRTFILEVMGRNCGYLASVSGVISEADYVFIPEAPPPVNWQEKLCDKLLKERALGQRLNIIIVSEGACDINGDPITVDSVRTVIVDKLKQDARITVLGHVQRGGSPSSFDRILGCRMGAEAVVALMEATEDTEPSVISLNGNKAIRVSLMDCVEKTKAVATALQQRQWEAAVRLRGKSFEHNLETFKMLTRLKPPDPDSSDDHRFTLGVMHVGAPACGMNAAVRSFVRNCICRGDKVLGIHEGVQGLVDDEKITEMKWSDVGGWIAEGGAFLGTKRAKPTAETLPLIADRLRKNKINGLLVIGGFEAFETVLIFAENRNKFPSLCIPLICIPATISNNVPGTDFSLGSDTSLNEITEICDRIRQSAQGTKNRTFIVETMGGYCGYLATFAGLAGGCDAAYIFEENNSIDDYVQDVRHIASKMACGGISRGLVLRNEKANENYDTEFVHRLYTEVGKGVMSTRCNVLGHMQQGGAPTPFDRNLATKLGKHASDFFHDKLSEKLKWDTPNSAIVLGLVGQSYKFSSVQELKLYTDFKHRIPIDQWWLRLRPLLRILAKHESTYEDEAINFEYENLLISPI